MLGLPESVVIFAALALGVAVALFAAARLLPGRLRAVSRTFWCPFRRVDVTVEFQEDPFGHGRYLDVQRCTAFRRAIACGKLCRYLREFPGQRHDPGAPA